MRRRGFLKLAVGVIGTAQLALSTIMYPDSAPAPARVKPLERKNEEIAKSPIWARQAQLRGETPVNSMEVVDAAVLEAFGQVIVDGRSRWHA